MVKRILIIINYLAGQNKAEPQIRIVHIQICHMQNHIDPILNGIAVDEQQTSCFNHIAVIQQITVQDFF